MGVHQLTEGAVDTITAYIQANIGAALNTVAAKYSDGISLENPRSYFTYPKAQGYRLPAVFVIADEIDFNIDKNKANFISATDRFKISILVEEKDEDRVTRKCWRYQSALHSVIDQAQMVSSDNLLKLVGGVYKSSYSPVWTDAKGEDGQFRKEVVLECEVTHLENY